MTTHISLYKQAFTGEAVLGTAQDHNPILATDGLRTCIGFAGIDRTQRIGFLVHFAGPLQVDCFYNEGVKRLVEMSNKSALVFNCIIRGGCSKAKSSLEILEKIKSGLHQHDSIVEFCVTEEEEPSKNFTLKTLSLDLRSGAFGHYSAVEDLAPRQRDSRYEERTKTLSLFEELEFPEI